MKIICIGRNYGAHARELGNAIPEDPVFFLKPETAVHPPGNTFKIPEWAGNIHYELELVFRISRECKKVDVKELAAFVDGVTIGLDLTARDVQDDLKKKGLPWERAKAFDGSAVLGHAFIPIPSDSRNISFQLQLNNAIVQEGNSSQMIFFPEQLITHVSRYITLLPGDLLFTGTPAGVGPISPGDHLIGSLGTRPMLELQIEG